MDKLQPSQLKLILQQLEKLAHKWNLIQRDKYKHRIQNYGTFDSEVKQYLPISVAQDFFSLKTV